MLQRLLLITILMACAISLAGLINPALMLGGIPPCDGFAGEPAMRVANWTTHLTYLHYNAYNSRQIIYVRILPDNSVTSCVVDTAPDSDFHLQPAHFPTLEIDGNSVYIFYDKQGQVFRAVSTDNGSSFTTAVVEPLPDALPLYGKQDGNWTSFVTPSDPVAEDSYMLFSNHDISETGSPAYFWGPDEVRGAVRANTDIWIKQAGGGNNNGWPTFYGPVYTSGQIQSFSGAPPYEMVFRAGYWEHMPELKTDTTTLDWYLQHNGTVIGAPSISENRILFVTVNGSSYSSMQGDIVQTGLDTLWVYSDYPPGNGAPLYANLVPHVDTLWVAGPSGTSAGCINIVNSILWIRGTFAGKQTWYSPYNIMINNDILLQSVPVGTEPPINSPDFVSLVSGKKLIIQYGYKDPVDSLRYHPNCDGNEQGVFIYASLYAMRPDRFGNPFQDGMFTFEYQRPHVSIPDYTWNGTPYTQIDLHRRHYPQTAANPWTPNIDLPYYNPLWPEGNPFMERGTVHLYGSVAQQRKGYMHCNRIDADFPNPTGMWDVDNGYLGGQSGSPVTDPVTGSTYVPYNAPGATGSGAGYSYKDYHFDGRLAFDTFSYNPFGLGMRYKTSTDGENWAYKRFTSLNEPQRSKAMALRDGRTALSYNDHLFWQPSATAEVSDLLLTCSPADSLQNMLITPSSHLLLHLYRNNAAGQDSVRLVELYPSSNATQQRFALPVVSRINSLFSRIDGGGCFATLEADGRIRFYLPDAEGTMQSWALWNPEIGNFSEDLFDLDRSSLSITENSSGYLHIILSLAHHTDTGYSLYYATGLLQQTGTADPTLPQPDISTTLYPNPFRQNLTCRIKTNLPISADLAVYNLKGQKVRILASNYLLTKGTHDFSWDGLDSRGKATASGIYFLRSTAAGHTELHNLLKIR